MIPKPTKRAMCMACTGAGLIVDDGVPIQCSRCRGNGIINSEKYVHRPMKDRVIDAPFIGAMLKKRYTGAGWVYISELRDSSGFGAKRTIDGYAVYTGTDPKYMAFEIKVTRADFKRDLKSGKWREWLDKADAFYFVSPENVITRDDLATMPRKVGLMWVNGRGCHVQQYPYSTERLKMSPEFVAVMIKRLGEAR